MNPAAAWDRYLNLEGHGADLRLARAFEAFGGAPQRGIYNNIKTAVDQVLAGKKRKTNADFEVITGHCLFEPFATGAPASGIAYQWLYVKV